MKNTYMKLFFYCSMLFLLLYLYMWCRDIRYTNDDVYNKVYDLKSSVGDIKDYLSKELKGTVQEIKSYLNTETKKSNLKYILQWTSSKNVPFVYMGEGQKGFIERNCTYTNCYVTADRSYLGDYTEFDVIAFSGPEVVFMRPGALPTKRSPHQKFAFASIESSANYPLCTNYLNGFFNWTWTYRLDSEAKWGYMAIRDSENKIIGPKTNMSWIDLKDMKPTSDDVKEKISHKTKAAAWFVSNCYTRSNRKLFAWKLQKQLIKYNLSIDVYGECGTLSCSRDTEEECNDMLERDYYFYLSFENSFAKDYVTEKLLHPLMHLAVPIVYGGANYKSFMPDGIYLNARDLGVKKVAEKMDELIKNPDQYAEYFRWRNHYSYHRRSESVETDDYCRFCSILNEEDTVKKTTIYQNFKDWWTGSQC